MKAVMCYDTIGQLLPSLRSLKIVWELFRTSHKPSGCSGSPRHTDGPQDIPKGPIPAQSQGSLYLHMCKKSLFNGNLLPFYPLGYTCGRHMSFLMLIHGPVIQSIWMGIQL